MGQEGYWLIFKKVLFDSVDKLDLHIVSRLGDVLWDVMEREISVRLLVFDL